MKRLFYVLTVLSVLLIADNGLSAKCHEPPQGPPGPTGPTGPEAFTPLFASGKLTIPQTIDVTTGFGEPINFDTDSVTGGGIAHSGANFTIPAGGGGVYEVTWSIIFANIDTNPFDNFFGLNLLVDGSNAPPGQGLVGLWEQEPDPTVTGITTTLSGQVLVRLDPGTLLI